MCERYSVGILKFNWIQLEFLISNGGLPANSLAAAAAKRAAEWKKVFAFFANPVATALQTFPFGKDLIYL